MTDKYETLEQREKQLNRRLEQIYKRIEWMANTEARAVWIGGFGAKGEFMPEKERLIDETERILNELEKFSVSPEPNPRG